MSSIRGFTVLKFLPLCFSQAGSVVLSVTVVDEDEGANAILDYHLINNTDNAFSLTPGLLPFSSPMLLAVARPLDYETLPEYHLTLMARDRGNPALSSIATVVIDLAGIPDAVPVFNSSSYTDVNNNPPVFDQSPQTVDIAENQPPYTTVFNVSTTDADSGINSGVRFSLSGDVRVMESFGVGVSTGHVFTLKGLDREERAEYRLEVLATDTGSPPQTNTLVIVVRVTDERDDPPMFSQAAYEVLVVGPRPLNATLVTVEATTRDEITQSSIIRYRIVVGGNSSLFTVGERGVVSAAVAIDPGVHAGRYMFRVAAEHAGFSREAVVAITVMEDSDVPVIAPLSIHLSVYPTLFPSRTRLGTIQLLHDPRHAPYTFSLLSPSFPSPQGFFKVNPSTGDLYTFSNVTSGLYTLNLSVSTPSSARGHGVTEVRVVIISNATLENAVGVVFAGVSEERLVSALLQPFLVFVASTLSMSQRHVEVVGIQGEGQGVELVFAVRETDFQTYVPAGDIERLLLLATTSSSSSSSSGGFPQFPSFRVADSACANSNTCPQLQTCHALFHLHSTASFSAGPRPLVSASAGVVYFVHPFSRSRRCICPDGFSRDDLCASEVNECNPSPCYFGAECVDEVGGSRCLCPRTTMGENCTIVCPSASCAPCSSSPCLHGGSCTPNSQTGEYDCLCPSPQHSGPNCEFTSVHFGSDASFLALPTLTRTISLHLSLQFATIAHSGLLVYSGRRGQREDYIAMEMLIGQVKVGVSFGGVATELMTQSERGLNDGMWHRVDLVIENRVRKGEKTLSFDQLITLFCCLSGCHGYCIELL